MGEPESQEKSDAPFSRRYLDALIAGVEGARERLPEIAEAGEAVRRAGGGSGIVQAAIYWAVVGAATIY